MTIASSTTSRSSGPSRSAAAATHAPYRHASRLRAPLACASALCALVLCAPTGAQALTLWGAGSLSGAIGTIAGNYTAATGVPVTTMFTGSGTLRQEIEAGGRPDLFTSADTGNPQALANEGLAGPVMDFASNRLVVVAKPGLAVTSASLLSALLNPALTLGTSTPVYDPLGDYTEQVFADADALVPGLKATLDAKAQRLIAGPTSPTVPAGVNSLVYFVADTGQADLFITYYTSALAALAIDPALQEIELPANLATAAEYGLTVVNGAAPGTGALANYILSPAGQTVLASYGFGAPTAVPEPASAGLLAVALAGLVASVARSRRSGRGVG